MKIRILQFIAAITVFLGFTNKTEAQKIVRYEYVDGDSLPVYEFSEIVYSELADSMARKRYLRLVYNLRIVFPYAKMAAFRLQLMEDNLRQLKGKERKEYLKQSEKSFKEEFTGFLKTMPRDRGVLLTKLIYRETGKTAYEILEAFTGSFQTFLWNTTASVFGGDLKDTFDPMEDYQIEHVIKSLELE
jgi:hypothetical protein